MKLQSLARYVILCWVLFGALLPVVPAPAAEIVVTATADAIATDGNCTLREAIIAANTNATVDACTAGEAGPGIVDVVRLPAATFVLSLGPAGDDSAQRGDLDLTDDVEIVGAGARLTLIDGDFLDRLFDVDPNQSGIVAGIADLHLLDGDAGGGNGGCVQNGGDLTIERVTLSGCLASGPGGGIRNNAMVHVIASTLLGNTTDDHGGGIDNHGTAIFENVTVVDNTVTGGGVGGGIYVDTNRNLTLVNSTVVGNTAGGGSGLQINGALTATNSLVSGACNGNPATSGGGNVESPGNACGFDQVTDQVSVANPLLDPLANYGGPTDTLRPAAGSPALDGGIDGPCLATDQRSAPRPFDGDGDLIARCDVGAHEAGSPVTIFADGFDNGDTSSWSATVAM